MTLTLDFEGQIFKKLYHRNKRVDWHKKMWIHRMLDPSCDFKLLPHPWPWPWIFKVKFLIAIRNGKADWLGMKEMWVRYNVGCTMAFLLAHSAWQIDFEPVGPWMGYSFTDLGAEGCCRSLNALLNMYMYTWQKISRRCEIYTCIILMNSMLTLAYLRTVFDKPVSQIPQFIRQISHNAPFCNKNMHV